MFSILYKMHVFSYMDIHYYKFDVDELWFSVEVL